MPDYSAQKYGAGSGSGNDYRRSGLAYDAAIHYYYRRMSRTPRLHNLIAVINYAS